VSRINHPRYAAFIAASSSTAFRHSCLQAAAALFTGNKKARTDEGPGFLSNQVNVSEAVH
jgi:hypothetical protein